VLGLHLCPLVLPLQFPEETADEFVEEDVVMYVSMYVCMNRGERGSVRSRVLCCVCERERVCVCD